MWKQNERFSYELFNYVITHCQTWIIQWPHDNLTTIEKSIYNDIHDPHWMFANENETLDIWIDKNVRVAELSVSTYLSRWTVSFKVDG